MPLERAQQCSGLCIPDPHAVVPAAPDDGLAVRAHRHAVDREFISIYDSHKRASLCQTTQFRHPHLALDQCAGPFQKTIKPHSAIYQIRPDLFDVQLRHLEHEPLGFVEALLAGHWQAEVGAGLAVKQRAYVRHPRRNAPKHLRNELFRVFAQDVRHHGQGAVQARRSGVGVVAIIVVVQQGLDATLVEARLYPVKVQQQVVQAFLQGARGKVCRHVPHEIGVGVLPVL